jgi:hypothetical protein
MLCSEGKLSIFTGSDNISTPNEVADAQRLTRLDRTWHRLIPSRFPPIRVYERIAPADHRHAAVTEIETLTSPRVRARERLIGIGAVDEASPRLQNWNHAPFTYLNPEGSTLFRPGVAALELFDTLQTALAASVSRRERFLRSTRMPKLGLDMRVLTTRIMGRFMDLRDGPLPDSREARWDIGDALVNGRADGALFLCPERDGATCLAILNGDILERTVQADHFRFVWDGERIASLYSFSGEGTVLNAEALAGPPIRELT